MLCAGNTEECSLDEVPGDRDLNPDHSYSCLPGPGTTTSSCSEPAGARQQPHEAEPSPPRSLASSVSAAASPTDSSPAVSPCPATSHGSAPGTSSGCGNNDTNSKYKKNMLWRYLNDVTAAHQSLTKDRLNKSDGVDSHSSVSDQEYFPEPEPELPAVAQELVYPAVLSPGPGLPAPGGWEAVITEAVPAASNNITISFSHQAGASSCGVPVISPPPRDNLGVDKVKRQLGSAASVVVLQPQPPQQPGLGFSSPSSSSSSYPPPPQTPASASAASSGPPASVFSPAMFRPVSVLPLGSLGSLGPPYPFLQSSSWSPAPASSFPLPQLQPHFLHLIPDSSKLTAEQACKRCLTMFKMESTILGKCVFGKLVCKTFTDRQFGIAMVIKKISVHLGRTCLNAHS